MKIIECQFEARRQDVKVSQLYSGAAIGDIPNRASEYTARHIENINALFEIFVLPMNRRSTIVRHRSRAHSPAKGLTTE
jgi:hypothetical protein